MATMKKYLFLTLLILLTSCVNLSKVKEVGTYGHNLTKDVRTYVNRNQNLLDETQFFTAINQNKLPLCPENLNYCIKDSYRDREILIYQTLQLIEVLHHYSRLLESLSQNRPISEVEEIMLAFEQQITKVNKILPSQKLTTIINDFDLQSRLNSTNNILISTTKTLSSLVTIDLFKPITTILNFTRSTSQNIKYEKVVRKIVIAQHEAIIDTISILEAKLLIITSSTDQYHQDLINKYRYSVKYAWNGNRSKVIILDHKQKLDTVIKDTQITNLTENYFFKLEVLRNSFQSLHSTILKKKKISKKDYLKDSISNINQNVRNIKKH